MKIPLEAVTDTELLTEVARRRLDIRDNVNEGMVNETYEMGMSYALFITRMCCAV